MIGDERAEPALARAGNPRAGSHGIDVGRARKIQQERRLTERIAVSNAHAVSAVIGSPPLRVEQLHGFLGVAERIGATWMRVTAAAGFAPVIHELDPEGALDFLPRHLELAIRGGNHLQLPDLAMFRGLQLLRTGDLTTAATSLAVAVREASERCPTYLGTNANATIALTLREWPGTAAVLLGGLDTWRREHDQEGTTVERDTEHDCGQRLHEVLGDDFESHHTRGATMSEHELADMLIMILTAIADGTVSDEPGEVSSGAPTPGISSPRGDSNS